MKNEHTIKGLGGWSMLLVNLTFIFGGFAAFINLVTKTKEPSLLWLALLTVIVAAGVSLSGHYTLQPGESAVLTLFGDYVGTVKEPGFKWTNPFNKRRKLSLRSRNLNGEKLKVNDRSGNPIEIGAVVVWHVENTFQACFEVDDFLDYVQVQSESAVRHLASSYAYDHGDEDEITLRSSTDEISEALAKELQKRLGQAGVIVEEARLTHLAYAPEIAQAMLKRQQAEAVIAARTRIVEGAVSMVEMALHQLADKNMVELDEDRKAAMVSNLLVVLCGETDVQPVVNTGTLYS